MAHPTYDEYRDVPKDLIPTRKDEMGLQDIVIDVKEAIRVRHDFNTALDLANRAKGERRLAPANPVWESNFAKTFRPDAKTMAGLAAEHNRLAQDAQQAAMSELGGNPKLAKLVRDNLRSLFPDIGYNASRGEAVERLRKGPRTVLSIFHPLGVEDFPRLIRLLLFPPQNYAFYW